MKKVFISYSTADMAFVDQLVNDLRAAGINVWKTPENIQPGENWVHAIELGLSTSTHYLLIKSPNAVQSRWVNVEFETAFELHQEGRMVIIPIDYQPCDPPLFWRHFQHITLRDNKSPGLLPLIRRINDEHPEFTPIPTAPIINIQIGGDLLSTLTVAGHDVLQSGPDAGRPALLSITPPESIPESEAAPNNEFDVGEEMAQKSGDEVASTHSVPQALKVEVGAAPEQLKAYPSHLTPEDIDALKQQLAQHRRNRNRLMIMRSKYTINVPIEILNQIDDEEKAIQSIMDQLEQHDIA